MWGSKSRKPATYCQMDTLAKEDLQRVHIGEMMKSWISNRSMLPPCKPGFQLEPRVKLRRRGGSIGKLQFAGGIARADSPKTIANLSTCGSYHITDNAKWDYLEKNSGSETASDKWGCEHSPRSIMPRLIDWIVVSGRSTFRPCDRGLARPTIIWTFWDTLTWR